MDSPKEHLQGSIERITFHSEDTGFCVLRIQAKGHRDLVTVLGNAVSIGVGEQVECVGLWIHDKKHGLQFKAQQLKTIRPTNLAGIEKYLASGMIKGIGRHFAKKLVHAFGESVLEVIENQPERLTELEGMGHKRKEYIIRAWSEQKSIRNIMLFLQSHGVGTARAVRIYKTYGDDAIAKVRKNPYCLALDIRGIGFKTADLLAEQLGIAKDALIRARAGVRHVLQELCNQGHCAAVYAALVHTSHTLLTIPLSTIEQAIALEIQEKNLAQDTIAAQTCVYPISLYLAEVHSARHIQRLMAGSSPWGTLSIEKAITWVETQSSHTLSASQRTALARVLHSKLSIITGGPGVGKTTLVSSLLKIIRAKRLSIGLCAPTGRAAKRLTETTGLTAKTIHRLLEFQPQTYHFKYHSNNPLPLDVLIVDESSMIDITLLHHLLKAIPSHAAVIFVGDIDQLPSVGSGAVLADLIRSETLTTVRLTEVFRQAAHSQIITNAHRINEGKLPLPNGDASSDFFTLYTDTPEAIHDTLIDLVAHRLPQHYQCDPIRAIQVMTPMNRGGLGSRTLNVALQKQLNGRSEPTLSRFGSVYAPGDKVIQLTNNYDKEVFNGDIGFIERIDLEESMVYIRFDQQIKPYAQHELDEINLAYAISIHKSQGSEFPIVVIPLAMQHYTLLARNLLYTGVTRGKKLVVLVGQKKAIAMAVRNNRELNRLTKLAYRLKENVEEKSH